MQEQKKVQDMKELREVENYWFQLGVQNYSDMYSKNELENELEMNVYVTAHLLT